MLTRLALIVVIAYLLGSIPSAVIITRWFRGIDVRSVGSGHAGATNTLRVAGWLPAALVALLDVGKGFVAVALALRWADPMAGSLAAGAAVLGHCWPLFARFEGGMGVATAVGALLAVSPLGLVLAVGIDSALNLLLRHTARANVITGIISGAFFWLLGLEPAAVGVGAAAGLIVALRSAHDWDRVYRELWLDRRGED